MEEKKELLLFQLGPVQEFIAQAETIGDLRAGSEILSELTAAALATIPDYWENAVFPAVEKDALKGIPNRFLVWVERGKKGEDLAKDAANAARNWLKDRIAAPVREKYTRKEAFDAQIEAFLQTTWAVLKNPSGNMSEDYKTIGKLMAMRRNVRAFDAWPEEDNGQVKDFLTGKEAALDVVRESPNRNSGRGAMNLIKKDRTTDRDRIIAENLGKYIAVIAMDGDHMGAKLSGFKTAEEHRAFSRRLAEYATSVEIDAADGVLIYAGGDDVLAVVKATRAFEISQKLAERFVEQLNEKDEGGNVRREITASVGVAIGSSKAPLQDLIHEAHAAEGRAKHVYGRDALAVSVLKRSGEILKWGCKWRAKGSTEKSSALKLYGAMATKAGKLSRFAYKLAGFLAPYNLGARDEEERLVVDWSAMKDVVKQETLHSIEQTEGMTGVLSECDIDDYLNAVVSHPEDFLGLFLCETFISRPKE